MTRDHNDVALPWVLAEEVARRPHAAAPSGPAGPPGSPGPPGRSVGAGDAVDPDDVRPWRLDEVVRRLPPGEPDVA